MNIGIIGAMEAEILFLQKTMQLIETIEVAGNTFYLGQLQGHHAVLLQCGIGKVNAALGTTLLIERFKPDYVINTGSAGGLHQTLAVGDVVISLEVRHHDVDLTIWGYEHGQVPKLPSAFIPSQILVHAAEQAAKKMSLRVTQGLIVSGDSFIHQDVDIVEIRGNFPNAHAVEMEAAAIAQVCHQFKMPFVIIRAVSDMAGIDTPALSDLYLAGAARNSAELIINTLTELG